MFVVILGFVFCLSTGWSTSQSEIALPAVERLVSCLDRRGGEFLVRVVGLLTLLFAGTSVAGALDDYLAIATGSFTSAAQAATDSRYDDVTWHIAEIWRDKPDAERWLYTESWMAGADAPYMQRISSVVEREDGSLLTRRFRLPIPPSQRAAGLREAGAHAGLR
jgi:hypothetical protein